MILTLPLLFDAVLFVHHVATYRGICGPHPTDIPAHSCGFATYSREFFTGWEAIGFVILDACLLVLLVFGPSVLAVPLLSSYR